MHNKHNQKKYFIINPAILYLNINHITFLTYLPLLKKELTITSITPIV